MIEFYKSTRPTSTDVIIQFPVEDYQCFYYESWKDEVSILNRHATVEQHKWKKVKSKEETQLFQRFFIGKILK